MVVAVVSAPTILFVDLASVFYRRPSPVAPTTVLPFQGRRAKAVMHGVDGVEMYVESRAWPTTAPGVYAVA